MNDSDLDKSFKELQAELAGIFGDKPKPVHQPMSIPVWLTYVIVFFSGIVIGTGFGLLISQVM